MEIRYIALTGISGAARPDNGHPVHDDAGEGKMQSRLDTDRKLRNHIRQIQALGFAVTITKAA